MNQLIQTPSQTVGPYFAYGLTAAQYNYDYTQICNENLIKRDDIKGERITIAGQVLDGEGNPVPDALVEIWQADAYGQYATDTKSFIGFGRMGTGSDAASGFTFHTIKPGSVEGQAPHITLIIFMRGLLVHAYTRLYFSDEAEWNQRDVILNTIPEQRRSTLIAERKEKNGRVEYRFDMHMQGEKETVFFDV